MTIIKTAQPSLLLQSTRDGLVEEEFFGFIKLLGENIKTVSIGDDNNQQFFHRSAAKPLIASVMIDLELIEYFKLTEKEIAISCASHTGEKVHTDVIEKYLEKINAHKNDLKCGLQLPVSEMAKREMEKEGRGAEILTNNCSGKHTFMLAASIKCGYDLKTYFEAQHPLQKLIYEKIKLLCEAKNELIMTKDGCSVPIYATSLEELGKGYLNIFTDKKYEPIKNAFINQPYIIGGQGRIDSEIMAANKNLIAKVGAGGFIIIVNLRLNQVLVIKMSNSEPKSRSHAAIYALKQLGWLSDEQITNTPLKRLFRTEVKTLHGDKVGEIIPNFDFSQMS